MSPAYTRGRHAENAGRFYEKAILLSEKFQALT